MAQSIQTTKFGTLDTGGRIPVYFTGAGQDVNTPDLNLGLSFTINGKNYTFIPEDRVSTGAATANDGRAFPGFLDPNLLASLKNNSEYVNIAGTQFGSFDIGNYIAQQMGGSTKGYLATEDVVKPIIDAGVTLYDPSFAGKITGVGSAEGRPVYSTGSGYLTPEGRQTKTTREIIGWRESGGLGGLGSFLASIDPTSAISRAATDLFQPVEKAVSAGVQELSNAYSTKDAQIAYAIAASFFLPGVGSALGQTLVSQGLITGAATQYATAIGTALASTGASVAQGVPFDTALTNATVNAVTSTGSQSVAGYISKLGASPEVANAITSVGASGLATAAKGGSAADIETNMKGALAGSTVTGLTGDKLSGAVVGGAVSGGTAGAVAPIAGSLIGSALGGGEDTAKAGDTPTTTPTTQATLTPNLTDAQVSQIQNALGISVSDATNNDVKLALGPLLAPLGVGAAIVSDSVIPLIGIFGAKAVSDTIDYFKNQNDSAGFYKWVNENMQAADDRVQNNQSLNPAGAGRGFVNPPVATTITPSQAAVTGTYGAGFSGAGGGAGAGVTAGETTAGEQEAKDFLAAQKVTHPEIDFATLAQEPALNELPADKKIIDLIQPGAAATAAVPPGTTAADRDILNLTGITQPGTSTVTPSTAATQPSTFSQPAGAGAGTGGDSGVYGSRQDPGYKPGVYNPIGDISGNVTRYPTDVYEGGDTDYIPPYGGVPVEQTPTTVTPTNVTPATFTPAIAPILVPQTPTRPANQPVVDTFPGPTTVPTQAEPTAGQERAPISAPISAPTLATTTVVVPSRPPPPPRGPIIDNFPGPRTNTGDPSGNVVVGPGPDAGPGNVGNVTIISGEDDGNAAPNVSANVVVKKVEPPPDDDKLPEDKVISEPEPDPDIFIYGKTTPKTKTRTRTDLSTTLQAPFYPSSTLGQALTGYRGAGEIEGKKTGKPRKNVWNEESLRLKDALGL